MPTISCPRFLSRILAPAVSLICFGTYALEQPSQDVQILFKATLAGQAFECGKLYTKVGNPHQTITPTDWRMFISDISLLDAQGQWIPLQLRPDGVWQNSQIALLDFENGKGACRNGTTGLNPTAKGHAPAKTYNGIKFTIGVPFIQNHGDPTTATSPLSNTAMFWNWQGGYKFIKFDALTASENITASSNQRSAFAFHLGSTQCTSTAQTQPPSKTCQKPNLIQVELLGQDPLSTPVVFDMAALLRDTDVANNTPHTPPGCMSTASDPDCTEIFRQLNLLAPSSAALTPGFVRWSK